MIFFTQSRKERKAKSGVNIISGAVINFIAPIWYPQTVTITCENTN